jgi:hypothetical protein
MGSRTEVRQTPLFLLRVGSTSAEVCKGSQGLKPDRADVYACTATLPDEYVAALQPHLP